jgi:CrcB protein
MREVLMIGVAGALGAMSRYGLGVLSERWSTGSWPLGTLAANLLGCLALGVVMEAMELRDFVSREASLAITVGFLGAFTTFSTFSHETLRLFDRGEATVAVAYVAVSVFAGCALCYAGVRLSRAIWGA